MTRFLTTPTPRPSGELSRKQTLGVLMTLPFLLIAVIVTIKLLCKALFY